MSSSSSDPSLETVAPRAAVTSERKLNPDLQEQVPKPCTYISLSPPTWSGLRMFRDRWEFLCLSPVLCGVR
jgi:hypothetical protein